MALHVIPEYEKDLHTEDQNCICEPNFILDDESGEMVWAHQIINPEKLFEDFVTL